MRVWWVERCARPLTLEAELDATADPLAGGRPELVWHFAVANATIDRACDGELRELDDARVDRVDGADVLVAKAQVFVLLDEERIAALGTKHGVVLLICAHGNRQGSGGGA